MLPDAVVMAFEDGSGTLSVAIAVFLAAAMVIIYAGTRLTALADELADRTGIGEALMGALVLGAVTSLPGITASVNAAINGAANLSLSNAYGGIALQTLFLAVADIFYRKANLEHAAASLENLMMGHSFDCPAWDNCHGQCQSWLGSAGGAPRHTLAVCGICLFHEAGAGGKTVATLVAEDYR